MKSMPNVNILINALIIPDPDTHIIYIRYVIVKGNSRKVETF